MENNLTQGNVLKVILKFSLPFFISYFLQTLYGMADLFIIGRFNGVESTTAVSVGSQVMHMLTVMIVGLAMGSTVLIGRAVGADRKKDASCIIGNTIALFTVLSVVLTFVLLAFVKPIVAIMLTPDKAVSGTVSYLTVCFIGIPFITAYNIISSVFRGMGDSKSPMYFIAVACAANIILDYFFIGVLHMGPIGAALGTTISQTLSAVVSLIVISKKQTGISLSLHDLRPSADTIKELLHIGIPVALQDGFIQISFLVITAIANKRGLQDAAAVGVVEKIIGILFLVPSSMLSAVSAICSHNIGAQRYDRAKQTLCYSICIAAGFGLISAVFMQFEAEEALGIFVKSSETGVIYAGSQYLRGYVWDCVLAGIHFCFSGYFCACGKSGLSFIHNFIAIITARIPLAWLASKIFTDTLMPMGFATTTGSGVSVVICVAAYVYLNRKYRQTPMG